MVSPIKHEPMQPSKHVKPADRKKKLTDLHKQKEAVKKLAQGRLGAGKPPQFSTRSRSEAKKVTQVVKDTLRLSKR